MRVTLSIIKADVGSGGGHTRPSRIMMEATESEVQKAARRGLLIDGLATHTGDDIALVMSHRHGVGAPEIHRFAWRRQGFIGATMASHAELAYTGIVDTLSALEKEFTSREEPAPVRSAA